MAGEVVTTVVDVFVTSWFVDLVTLEVLLEVGGVVFDDGVSICSALPDSVAEEVPALPSKVVSSVPVVDDVAVEDVFWVVEGVPCGCSIAQAVSDSAKRPHRQGK